MRHNLLCSVAGRGFSQGILRVSCVKLSVNWQFGQHTKVKCHVYHKPIKGALGQEQLVKLPAKITRQRVRIGKL